MVFLFERFCINVVLLDLFRVIIQSGREAKIGARMGDGGKIGFSFNIPKGVIKRARLDGGR